MKSFARDLIQNDMQGFLACIKAGSIGNASKYMKNSYSNYSDNELISIIRGGDNGALDFLLNKYKNLVRGKAKTLFLVGGDKDDLIQEGMIGLYMAIRDFDPNKHASFQTFADLCTTRRIYKAIDRSNAQKHMVLNESISLDNEVEGESEERALRTSSDDGTLGNPESLFLRKEEDDSLFEKLRDALSPLELEVLELYLTDTSYEDMAKKVSRSEKAVDNAIQRIRKKLRNLLG